MGVLWAGGDQTGLPRRKEPPLFCRPGLAQNVMGAGVGLPLPPGPGDEAVGSTPLNQQLLVTLAPRPASQGCPVAAQGL